MCFISDGWGGRVSDKHLTENSNLLSHLTPGDTILADRGFDIKESIGLYCATVAIPNFTRGKKQLIGIEVEQSRHIAKCAHICGACNWCHKSEIYNFICYTSYSNC